MLTVVMPDPLIWQSGHEYGLQALATLQRQSISLTCYIAERGAYLEAVAFAVHEMALEKAVRFVPQATDRMEQCHVVLLPRVAPLEMSLVENAAAAGKIVLTSDPQITTLLPRVILFPRRDWQALTQALLKSIPHG